LTLPKIYPITDRALSGLSHCEQVRRLIAGGARLIQLREKMLLPGDWLDDARCAVAAAASKGVRIVINDRTDLAKVLGADGVHLGQDDLPPEAARQMLGPHAIVGYSTHSLEQVEAAVRRPVDYIAFGPIFVTGTKNNSDPVVGLDLLNEVKRRVGKIPLVAIGGIREANLASIFAAGADSAAVISDIVGDRPNIAEKMRRIYSAVR
jgi:thiamine-phosphate pyrophosphorylase